MIRPTAAPLTGHPSAGVPNAQRTREHVTKQASVRTPAYSPPQWATELVSRAASFLGTEQTPTVIWHPSSDETPARLDNKNDKTQPIEGVRYPVADMTGAWTIKASPSPRTGVIEVWPGRSRRDQRFVLLHEIAHWYMPGHRHDRYFYECAWGLYQKFMPRSLGYILGREATGSTAALRAAVKAGIVDAKVAADDPHLRKAVRPL